MADKVKMKRVKSSMVHALGHDAEANELHVQFEEGGKIYPYSGFTAADHQSILQAKSIGAKFTELRRARAKKVA